MKFQESLCLGIQAKPKFQHLRLPESCNICTTESTEAEEELIRIAWNDVIYVKLIEQMRTYLVSTSYSQLI